MLEDIPPDVALELAQPRGDQTFEYLRESTHNYLAVVTKMRRSMLDAASECTKSQIKWSSPEEIVLFGGENFHTNIRECGYPAMPPANCFENAFRLALDDPSLRYYEGWAMMEQSMPTHHGWVVDANCHVHDPTWLNVIEDHDPEEIKGRAFYMGVHIPLANHIEWFFAKGTMNLLASGEMTDPEMLRWGLDIKAHYNATEGVVSDHDIAVIKRALDDAGHWTCDRSSGIFTHSETGAKWCGRTYKFIKENSV